MPNRINLAFESQLPTLHFPRRTVLANIVYSLTILRAPCREPAWRERRAAASVAATVLRVSRRVTHLVEAVVKSNPLGKGVRDFLGDILLLRDLLHQVVYFVQIPENISLNYFRILL